MLPGTYQIKICTASCTTFFSVYVNLSKNSTLSLPTRHWAKADAKVRIFSELPNFFKTFLMFKHTFFWSLDKYQTQKGIHIILYMKMVKQKGKSTNYAVGQKNTYLFHYLCGWTEKKYRSASIGALRYCLWSIGVITSYFLLQEPDQSVP